MPIVYQTYISISIVCGILFSIFIDYYQKGCEWMSEIAKSVGQRIRSYRIKLELSQEKLAELSGVHPTYIGQLERGEKNATLESIEKIAKALNISLSQLFEKLGDSPENRRSIPLECYELLSSKSEEEQQLLFEIISGIEKYKSN